MKNFYSHNYIDSENQKKTVEFQIIEDAIILEFDKNMSPKNALIELSRNNFFSIEKKLGKRRFLAIPKSDYIPERFKGIEQKQIGRLFKCSDDYQDEYYSNPNNSIIVYAQDLMKNLIKTIIRENNGIIKLEIDELIHAEFKNYSDQGEAIKKLQNTESIYAELNFSRS